MKRRNKRMVQLVEQNRANTDARNGIWQSTVQPLSVSFSVLLDSKYLKRGIPVRFRWTCKQSSWQSLILSLRKRTASLDNRSQWKMYTKAATENTRYQTSLPIEGTPDQQMTFWSHGRTLEVNISHARLLVSQRFKLIVSTSEKGLNNINVVVWAQVN